MGIKGVTADNPVIKRAWTPILQSTGTAPSGWSGDSSASVWHRHGDLVIVKGYINHTYNTSVGTGYWYVALPVPVKSLPSGNEGLVIGDWLYAQNFVSGARGRAFGHVLLTATGSASNIVYFGAINYNTSVSVYYLGPNSLASNDYKEAGYISFNLFYEAA